MNHWPPAELLQSVAEAAQDIVAPYRHDLISAEETVADLRLMLKRLNVDPFFAAGYIKGSDPKFPTEILRALARLKGGDA